MPKFFKIFFIISLSAILFSYYRLQFYAINQAEKIIFLEKNVKTLHEQHKIDSAINVDLMLWIDSINYFLPKLHDDSVKSLSAAMAQAGPLVKVGKPEVFVKNLTLSLLANIANPIRTDTFANAVWFSIDSYFVPPKISALDRKQTQGGSTGAGDVLTNFSDPLKNTSFKIESTTLRLSLKPYREGYMIKINTCNRFWIDSLYKHFSKLNVDLDQIVKIVSTENVVRQFMILFYLNKTPVLSLKGRKARAWYLVYYTDSNLDMYLGDYFSGKYDHKKPRYDTVNTVSYLKQIIHKYRNVEYNLGIYEANVLMQDSPNTKGLSSNYENSKYYYLIAGGDLYKI